MNTSETFIADLANKHGRERTALLPILQDMIESNHYVTDNELVLVAKELDISAAEVFGTASFYTFIDTVERGKFIIRLCKTITCDMKGKDEIIHAIEDTLKIKLGETTGDKRFSLLPTNCLGWCHKGPAMLINNDVYTELTPQKTIEIIESYMQK
ncbi:NAD(P)H-dependent oxidoreductase subunit E [candidate division KSB1 bacterium]